MMPLLAYYVVVAVFTGTVCGYYSHDDEEARVLEPLLCAAFWPVTLGVLIGYAMAKK